MKTWSPTGESDVYQKTLKHTHSLFFTRIAVKKLRYVQIHFSNSNSNFEVMDNVLNFQIRGG